MSDREVNEINRDKTDASEDLREISNITEQPQSYIESSRNFEQAEAIESELKNLIDDISIDSPRPIEVMPETQDVISRTLDFAKPVHPDDPPPPPDRQG